MKNRLLWIGDAAVSTGFARVTHNVLDHLHSTGYWDIHVLGINYLGDPHPYPYPIYPPQNLFHRDPFGASRSAELVKHLRPDVAVILNDPWNIPQYTQKIGAIPAVGYIAVDGLNCRGRMMNGLVHAVFWTEFGRSVAHEGGYLGPSSVIPLGVDLDIYKPHDRTDARKTMGISGYDDAFIVGNVNRNQPRKRLDLTIAAFAQMARNVEDAMLYLHVAPTGDQGYDVEQLCEYHRIPTRLILATPDIGHGIKEENLALTYSCFDLGMTTSQGEGWGLTTMEMMACGIPQVIPDWAALGEWIPNDCAFKVPCNLRLTTPNFINSIGATPTTERLTYALRCALHDDDRETIRANALTLVGQPQFRWSNIAARFEEVLYEVLSPVQVSI